MPPPLPPAGRALSRLEVVALGYLALPLALFVCTWLKWPAALAIAALGALSWRSAVHWPQAQRSPAMSIASWLLLFLVALLWLYVGGLLGGMPLNTDWQVRMAVLRDLTLGAWPVGYGETAGGELMLRFSMAYYLVPALLGKLLDVSLARLMLGLWTLVGVSIFFALVLTQNAQLKVRAQLLVLVVLVAFSGMDIVGYWLNRGHLPEPGMHIEWWDGLSQYSSNTTLLFWAPNHALPGWLTAAVAWRHRESGLDWAAAAMLLLAACLWSPLVVVGAAPLLVASALKGQPLQRGLRQALHPAVLAVLPGMLLLGAFVTFGVPQPVIDLAAAQTELQVGLLPTALPTHLQFALVEWLVLALVIWRSGPQSAVFWMAALELLLLPLLRFGPGNDVVMRGGIAPMAIITLACCDVLFAHSTTRLVRAGLVLVLLTGSYTGLQEVQRQFQPGSDWPDSGGTLVQRYGAPWHYVGVLKDSWLKRLLRDPVVLKVGP